MPTGSPPGGRSPRSPSGSACRSCRRASTLETATDDDLLRLRIRPGSARATFDELKAAPTALVDDDRSLGWVERNILPDGRWNLAPEPLLAQLAQVAEPAPLVLIPRRHWRRVNSYGRDLPSVLEREPANVLVHPADAAAAGVGDGGRIRVESAFGRLEGVARWTTRSAGVPSRSRTGSPTRT